MEEALYDRISFVRFCGFSLSSDLPDHSTICRFRNRLLEVNAFEKIFEEINRQLENKNLLVKNEVIVDAIIVESSRHPNKVEEEIAVDRKESETKTKKNVFYSDDLKAKWLTKGKKYYYGYKMHVAVNNINGSFTVNAHVTSANVSDTVELENIVNNCQLKAGTAVLADKGYDSKKNREMLKSKNLKQRIMKKAKRNKPLTNLEKRWNKLISKTRFKVEQSFGTLKRLYNLNRCRYLELKKGLMEFIICSMAFNLKKAIRL